MPDLSIEYYFHCLTAEHWQTVIQGKSGPHTVRWDSHSHKSPYGYDYSCDCWPYKKKGTCPHIEQAKQQHCNWQQFLDGGEPVEVDGEKRCPKCGGPVTSMGHGV